MTNAANAALEFSNRVVAECFTRAADRIESNPFKIASKFSPAPVEPNRYDRKQMTARESVAILLSARQRGIPIGPGARIPRTFLYDGTQLVIENGAARDAVAGGWVTFVPSRINPALGDFEVTEDGHTAFLSNWNVGRLSEHGFRIDANDAAE